MSATSLRARVLTRPVILKLLLGWGSVAVLAVAGELLTRHLATPVLFTVLALIVGVILAAASGVVTEAEHLAHRLGDPYGTLVLTLSIVLIEVILISAVMLGPGEHPTIARDSVMAVSMIILNLVIGVALVAGGRRHQELRPNRTGVSAYLSLLVVLVTVAFALPVVAGAAGSYLPGQAIPIVVLTIALYAGFLAAQMGRHRTDFQEVGAGAAAGGQAPATVRAPIGEVFAAHRGEILARGALLVVMVIPIVLLSHDMATLLDDGLDRLGAPVALSGVLIAMIVFLPETITAIRAALAGEIQRVSNLCHGALVSTVGLTIPAVLTIGLLTGQTVVLGESAPNLVLLAVSLAITATTFLSPRVTAMHGGAHLFVFALYAMTLFN